MVEYLVNKSVQELKKENEKAVEDAIREGKTAKV